MLSCCIEHILTKDALYLLSYISKLPFDNVDSISRDLKKIKPLFHLFLREKKFSAGWEIYTFDAKIPAVHPSYKRRKLEG